MTIRLLIVLAIILTAGCSDLRPTVSASKVPPTTSSPVSKEEGYRQEFYQAFSNNGVWGLGLYFAGFSHDNDIERREVCKAVAQGGWEAARSHLSSDRYKEFAGILGDAGYAQTFPTGDQLFAIGAKAFNER